MINIEREDRKYFTGLILASQSIRDFNPQNSDTEAAEKLKVLFELAQYKMILAQESNCKDILRTVFNDRITESQLKQIPHFGKGECLFSTGGEILHTFITITDQEKQLFKGGA